MKERRAKETAGCTVRSENAEKKSTRETVFVLVGLAFCELRVSIRVDVMCSGQLTFSDDARFDQQAPESSGRFGNRSSTREASESFGGILDDE